MTDLLSSGQVELCSKTPGWMLLPIVFKVAQRSAQPASETALWMVALSVGMVSLAKVENGMVEFLQPALTPLLLVAQMYIWRDRERGIAPGTSSGVFCMFFDTVWDRRLYTFSAIPVIALLTIFIILTHKGSRLLPSINIKEAVLPFSTRVVTVLVIIIGAESSAFGFPKSETGSILTLGAMKVLIWYFTTRIAGQSSWHAVSTAGTFGMMATINPSIYSTDTQAFLQPAGCHIALGQMIRMFPSHSKLKTALWSFSLIPLALLRIQSETYAAAHDEYVHRSSVQPSPGFKAWFEYAKLHHSPIIDDFDTLYRAISPFWKQSGKVFLDFSGKLAQTSCTHPYRIRDRSIRFLFNTALGELRGTLHDVETRVNHLDEPRVIVPPNPSGLGSQNDGQFNLTNISKQSSWSILTKFCSSQVDQADLCQHPGHSAMHGSLTSPAALRLFEGLVPVLSTGSLSTMSDILYPSPAYIETEFQYSEHRDIERNRKRNNLYWAASTTGGFVTNDQWPQFHRQRFVRLAQNLEKRQHAYLHEEIIIRRRLHKGDICEKQYCRQQHSYFRLKPGRVYKLPASKSAVIKQTLNREWHDDRLMPWVDVDRTVYIYRLLLEFARLHDQERLALLE
ncbi:glycosyltransferase family 90 protein [Aspergillus undulatus]|uniref:glycosyltransferase family 90 protein n=1 Tax=Aspergillus undulatus TaxID=1810928 RepID=UPI003CCD66F9